MSKIVCCSGYFNPLHFGHIEYFEKAKSLGDILVVIVNNDEQAFLKKGSTFMKQDERLKIIRSLRIVDFCVLSIDTDRTVCRTIEAVRPHIFANGGDQFNTNIPEKTICEKLGIELVDNLGEKLQSSSWLLEKAKQN
jgi:cytidyltransferase-like protein